MRRDRLLISLALAGQSVCALHLVGIFELAHVFGRVQCHQVFGLGKHYALAAGCAYELVHS